MLTLLLFSTALAQDADGDGLDVTVDCNDTDPAVGPAPTWFADEDGDGFGQDDVTVTSCTPPPQHVSRGGDCDDTDALVNPGAPWEECSPIDTDCDGDPLNGLPLLPLWVDEDHDGFGSATEPAEHGCPAEPWLGELADTYFVRSVDGLAIARDGLTTNDLDCDDLDADISPDSSELCDGIDNDCDELVDELGAIDATHWFEDSDGDGFGDHQPVASCEPLDGYAQQSGDCGDADPEVHPGAVEQCDGLDNDCDGHIDEDGDDAIRWFVDEDGDGLGDPRRERWTCDPPPNAVFNGDDDNDRVFDYPGAGCAVVPRSAGPVLLALLLLLVSRSASAQDADSDGWAVADGDCRDDDPAVHPGAFELCNGIDDDCDGTADEGVAGQAWEDNDADGYGGSTAVVVSFCAQPPPGHVENNLDCNDYNHRISPEAEEVCDGLDNDCNRIIDDDPVEGPMWYRDQDGDGFGSNSDSIVACEAVEGFVDVDGDCDDRDWQSHPDGIEVCDNRDNDCNGFFDDGAEDAWTWWHDEDGDGLGDPDAEETTCDVPDDAVFNAKDPDDTTAAGGGCECASATGSPALLVLPLLRRR